MSSVECFLSYFDKLVADANEPVPEDVQEFYNLLRNQRHVYADKPIFTDNGLQILEYLQSCDAKSLTAKDIADGMKTSSRQVSGAIRKLCGDGYVEKIPGMKPVIYCMTEKGKNFDIKNYKERLNDEQENDK